MARTPKIDLESHFFTPEYMALLQSRARPPRFEVTDEQVRVWLEPSLPDVDAHAQPPPAGHAARPRPGAHRRAWTGRASRSSSSASRARASSSSSATVQVEHARKANDALAAFVAQHPGPLRRPCQPARVAPRRRRQTSSSAASPSSASRAATSTRTSATPTSTTRGTSRSSSGPRRCGCRSTSTRRFRTRTCSSPYLGHGWALPGPGARLRPRDRRARDADRLLAGVFDRLPDLEIILGHLGEGLMHWLYRVDFDFNKPWMRSSHRPQIERKPSDYLRENFWYTTQRQLARLRAARDDPRGRRRPDHVRVRLPLGADRGRRRLHRGRSASATADREKICHGNAERLFGISI